ncbi:MAG: MDR family MFS transporter [Pseudomonadota bacterium]
MLAATAPPSTALNRPLITLSVMAASIMQALDTTIANVALPRIQGTLGATQSEMTWVLTSYIVASAIVMALTGWLSSRFGRKRVFLLSVAGFTLASALCGLSTSLPELVFFRTLQGISGAALIPASQAVLFDINPPDQYGKAMALWGIGVTMGPVIGPALGGWITENYSWRWVFYINVPIGILTLFGLFASLPEFKKKVDNFDFFGFLTLSMFIGALQIMLDRGDLKDWFGSTEIIVEALLCGIALYLFCIHTLTHKRPFVNPILFHDRNYVIGSILIFLIGIMLFASLALLPPMLQGIMNYDVITTGFITAPRGAGTMFAMMVVSRIVGKVDPRWIIGVGLSLTAYSLWQMSQFNLLMGEREVVVSGLIQGFGIGLCYVSISTLAFDTLPTDLRNEGTAFFNLMRNIGSSIGISLVQMWLTRSIQTAHATLAEHITPYHLDSIAYAASHIDPTTQVGLVALNSMIVRQASMIGYIDDFKIMMLMTLAVIPLLALFPKPKPVVKGAIAETME